MAHYGHVAFIRPTVCIFVTICLGIFLHAHINCLRFLWRYSLNFRELGKGSSSCTIDGVLAQQGIT